MQKKISDRQIQAEVGPEQDGMRLDAFWAFKLQDHGLSRNRIRQQIKESRAVRNDSLCTKPAIEVQAGDRLLLTLPPQETGIVPQAGDVQVVWQDQDLAVINKPPGLSVHPAPSETEHTLVHRLVYHFPDLEGQDALRPGIVHRLDKDTSGLLVAAKTPRAQAGLIDQFQAHSVHRRYLGVAWGVPDPARGTITGAIGRSPIHRKKMAVRPEDGRPATTYYAARLVLAGSAASVLDFRLETGRTHQIRVHMAHAGHALLGDPKYGRGTSSRRRLSPEQRGAVAALERQALHAAELGFVHPVTGESRHFTSALPADLAHLVAQLGGDLANLDQIRHI